ncbi:hypothetical protein [Microlunatus parietis]|uniref:Galactose oxidase, central domain n=1 Tax=Microlunatus parietis TaxID=682979 RepID=A0A7Y9I5I0_9ACTN|nr:hypothetical protein [Microlunatus parietis]NYE70670.1 hypothetical protein [Microlunatus parietis]
MALRRRLGSLLAGLLLLLPAACTATAPAPVWTTVDTLPAGFTAETLAPSPAGLIIGGRAADPARPMLLIEQADGVREVPLTPESAYGRTAALSSIAVAGDQVYAFGGDRGGAHANVRWSVWSGTPDGVREREQIFWVFGGQDAGSLTTMVARPAGPMIIGNWGSPRGLDITVWTARRNTWTRVDSRGSALASTTKELLSERGAAVLGDRVIIAGNALRLDESLLSRAVTWVQDSPGADWRRVDLPSAGTASTALDLACLDECLIAGIIDGKVAGWLGDGATWSRIELPDLSGDPRTAALRVFRVAEGWRIAVGDGATTTVIGPATDPIKGPAGRLIDAAGGDRARLLVEGPEGSRRLHELS